MTKITTDDFLREGISKGLIGAIAGAVMAVASMGGVVGVWAWNRWLDDQTARLMEDISADRAIDIAAATAASTERMETIVAQLDRIEARLDAIERLAQLPREIARLRPQSSGPLTDCIEGQTCILRVTLERTRRCASCQIIPGGTEFYWLDPLSGNRYTGLPINKRPSRNLGDTPRTIDWNVEVPDRVVPPGALDYCIIPSYTDCPGQVAGEREPYSAPEPICLENIPILQAPRR